MKMRRSSIWALALLVAACGSSSVTDTTGLASSTTTAGDSTTTMEPPPRAPDIDLNAIPDWFVNEDGAPAELVDAIGGQLGAEYVGSMAVEWPTGGIGCSSGNADLQVITPGYVIFFEEETTLIRVHASESGNWKECELGRPFEGVPVLTS